MLIGANGSGKSNLIRFFEMMSWMLRARRLAQFVTLQGGADDQLFRGSSVSPRMEATLIMRTDAGRNDYRFALEHAQPDRFMFVDEAFRFSKESTSAEREREWFLLGSGHTEAEILEAAQSDGPGNRTARVIVALLRSCAVYQFHDTSKESRFKQRWDSSDNAQLRSHGGNLAAVLLRLEREDIRRFELICYHISRVLPVFDRFEVEETNGTDKTFGPHLTSDGSLRLFALVTLLNLPLDMLPDVLLLDEPELGLHPAAIGLIAGRIKQRSLRTTLFARYRYSSPRQAPVKQEEWEGLQDDIVNSGDQPETLAERLFQLLDQNHDYAAATGDSHFFVRTLHNLGSSLLKHHQLRQVDMTRFGLMIERALIWEPTNRYCWMLWADWFLVQGHREACESTLREMLRLFPSDVHARVELARTLIARRKDYRDEAEHLLRQAMARDPDGGHARVVMARLLVSRHRPSDAEALLAEFLERHPDNLDVQRSLGRLRAGMYVFDDGRDEIRGAIGCDGPPKPLSGPLHELFRRGRLAGEFSRAQIAKVRGSVAPTDLIRQETLKGDPLAGFYSQWLMPEETPECPPHAWAWNACRHWQESASADRWRHLATQFPEAIPETEFLLVLATTGDDNQARATRWRARYGFHVGTAPRAVDAYMREAQERLDSPGRRERDELAVAVMACASADAPEFLPERAA